jgi:hypothetical protein
MIYIYIYINNGQDRNVKPNKFEILCRRLGFDIWVLSSLEDTLKFELVSYQFLRYKKIF